MMMIGGKDSAYFQGAEAGLASAAAAAAQGVIINQYFPSPGI